MSSVNLSISNIIYRQLFRITWLLICSWTPKYLNFLRVFILKLYGAKISKKVIIYSSVKIWSPSNLKIGADTCLGPNVNVYNVSRVAIGNNTIISQDVEVCTPSHNFTKQSFDLVSEPIQIGANCWIAAGAFVGPGSKIEDGVVLGARAVTVGQNLQVGVYAGNPAKKIKEKACIQFLF